MIRVLINVKQMSRLNKAYTAFSNLSNIQKSSNYCTTIKRKTHNSIVKSVLFLETQKLGGGGGEVNKLIN